MRPQVLIIGAGPVGLTLAMELTRYDVPVRVVDKAPARTDKSKALVLWSRTLELLERGPGSARFIEAGFKVDAVNMMSGNKLIGHVDMSTLDSPHNFALMLPQADTERLLEENLSELGVKVERNVEVTTLSVGDESVEAVLCRADGSQETVSAAWLAGCDGAHSVVRHSVGATFEGATDNSDWILADIHMRGYPCPDTEASVYWDKDGVFVIFPISPGRYRLIADLPASGAEHPPAPTMEQVQTLMNRRGPAGMEGYDPIWLAGFRINGRKISKYRWGRAFLLGDAAHVHSPAGGQGAYFAQGRPSIHGKAVHGFAPCRSTAREAGHVELSIKDDHSSMSGFFTVIKIPTAYKAAGAAIEAEPLGWIPPFLGFFARKDLSLRIDSPDRSSW